MPLIEAMDEKGRYLWRWKEYIGDVVEANRQAQKEPQKIGEGALGRKIASIPTSVYGAWQQEFNTKIGKTHNGWTTEWKAFLRKKIDAHPEFRTVDKMLHITPNQGSIFVK